LHVPSCWHWPLQQSASAVQWFPVEMQQVCPAPHVPVQQSRATLHGPPIAEHAHFDVALLHDLTPGAAQQSVSVPQLPPAATQPHWLSELQAPVQQSALRVHPVPSVPHPHLPVATSHTWLQHCESSVHALPFA
jgi:hypothetical protein